LRAGRGSDGVPRPIGDGIATFIILDVIDESLDILALQSAFTDALGQDSGALVAPTEFQEEAVPHVAFLVGPRRAVAMGPRDELLVGGSSEYLIPEVGVLDAKKTAAAAIEDEELGVTEVGLVDCGQLPTGVEANLVEHAAEINEAADLGVATAETGNVGHE